MVSGPSGLLRIYATKTKLGEIKLIDEKVDHPHCVVPGYIVFELRGKQRSLTAVCAADKASHAIPPPLADKILRQNQCSGNLDFSHRLGRKRHTVGHSLANL
jgi:hypothetical protein